MFCYWSDQNPKGSILYSITQVLLLLESGLEGRIQPEIVNNITWTEPVLSLICTSMYQDIVEYKVSYLGKRARQKKKKISKQLGKDFSRI